MTIAAAIPVKTTSRALFVLAAFTGAALIFLVQPMAAKVVLPILGGSPAVWNTSMAFFQLALLAGYSYAHLLQRISSVRNQAIVHVSVLLAAGLFLPLRMTAVFGDPPADNPTLWLLAVLALSIGAPFAAISATAPIVQAWHARVFHLSDREPYALYAASNFGSLLALLAYPLVVEPMTTLASQRLGWSLGYCAFALLMATLGLAAAGASPARPARAKAAATPSVGWPQRVVWVGLAAIPSSLMLGVTTHLTTDVASAPFLWVIPLALYLLTFIIAFQTRSVIRPNVALLLQASVLPAAAFFLHLQIGMGTQLLLQLNCFFLSALVCHQALVARRPDPAHLTEFYLWVSVGGVLGGAFNAFLAPVIFTSVVEYPLVLVLAVLARPAMSGPMTRLEMAAAVLGLAAAGAITLSARGLLGSASSGSPVYLLPVALLAAFLLRNRRWPFLLLVAALTLAAQSTAADTAVRRDRSFFGVLKQSEILAPGLGTVRRLIHGTTVHGAQVLDGPYRCRPLTYYAPETVIGSAFARALASGPPANVGVVGLGTGAVAAYTRPGDRLTFFEIDPLVVRIASDPARFSYTTACAKGRIQYAVGDARLTLARQAPGSFDVLLIDAFSSDAVPAHLLTVEAMRLYMSRIKPDGVLLMHLTNRHMDLAGPALAAARAVGASAVVTQYRPTPDATSRMAVAQVVMTVSRSPESLISHSGTDDRPTPAKNERPWTDDYTNILGAILAHR
jgi:spermidine synthase